jgi:Big-like domain-containing protein
MPTALARHVTCVSLLLLAGTGRAPGQSMDNEPLRKTDLVRMLTVGTIASSELAALVHRNCLSFAPTERDRADLVSLGADSGLLRALDACARRAAPPRPAPGRGAARARPSLARRRPSADTARRVVAPRRAAPPVAAVAPTVPPRASLSTTATGFVLGVGQRGSVGTRPALPLVFQVRDTAGRPVAGEDVTLGVTNGQLRAAHAVTDSSGRVSVDLTFGPRAGATVVRATVRALVREATLYPEPGATARLLLRCGDLPLDRRIAFTLDSPVIFRVTGQDAFGNAVPVPHVAAATGDRGVLRVDYAGGDSLGGIVRVTPGEPGSTSLVIVGSGRREDLTVVVLQNRDSGASCPRPG